MFWHSHVLPVQRAATPASRMPLKNNWLVIVCVLSFASYLCFSRGFGNFLIEVSTTLHKIAALRR